MTELVLIRGLPGSGKSTKARQDYPDHLHYEPDHLVCDTHGRYRFDAQLLERSWAFVLDMTDLALARGESVVVSDVFARNENVEPYRTLAAFHGAEFKVVTCTSNSGSKWAFWRWAESPLLYMKRLHLLHTPWGGVMLNFISRPDPWPDEHDHPANFRSFILRGWYKERRGASKNIYWSPYYWATNDREWWTGRGYGVSGINRMVASDDVTHAIYECHPDTLTLVCYGPRKRVWGYHTPKGWVPWREYGPT